MCVTYADLEEEKKMSSTQVGDTRNLVLIIGCRTRDVLGEDGMHPEEGCRLTSDEVRVVEMNKLLKSRHARVITLNKQFSDGNKFHIDTNTRTVKWVKRIED